MIDDVLIQPAAPEDAQGISELALRSKGYWGYDQAFLEDCREELSYTPRQIDSESYCFYVARDISKNKSLVGFFALNFLGCAILDLEALFVEPKYIGKGLGKRLLTKVLEQAKLANAASINIQGDPNAAPFYLANGAVKVGETESHSIPGRFLPQLEITL